MRRHKALCPTRARLVRFSARQRWAIGVALLGLTSLVGPLHADAQTFAYITTQGDNTVRIVNPSNNAVTGMIPVGTSPREIVTAQTANGTRLYVSNFSSDSVSVIDPTINQVVGSPILVGSGPEGLAVSPNGSRVYVVNRAKAGVRGSVSVVNTTTNMVIATIPVDFGPFDAAVTANGATLYVTNTTSGTVSIINTATNAVTGAITVASGPVGIAVTTTPNGEFAYVAGLTTDSVQIINTATNVLSPTQIAVGFDPFGVEANPSANRIYVTNFSSGSVSVIDTTSNTVIATVPVGGAPEGLALQPGGANVYVANFSNFVPGTFSVIATATNIGQRPVCGRRHEPA